MTKFLVLRNVNNKDYFYTIIMANEMVEVAEEIAKDDIKIPERFTIVPYDDFYFNVDGSVRCLEGSTLSTLQIFPMD